MLLWLAKSLLANFKKNPGFIIGSAYAEQLCSKILQSKLIYAIVTR